MGRNKSNWYIWLIIKQSASSEAQQQWEMYFKKGFVSLKK